MRVLTEQQVRRSFVNCSKGEANGLALPRGFDDLDWAELEVLGWRDPKAPLRGYLVVDGEDGPVGIAVRAADTRMSSRTAAMCLLCQTAQTGDAAGDVWRGSVAGHLTAHDRNDIAPRPCPRLQPQALTRAVEQ